ncbi:MAG TPA: glycosyltransferase family 2 protein [Nitrososphaeraceae archaeon]|jgi:cellulose synthase/poly-beta-1,6-N-acetylglucosamine synthase-like glycosyltransferase|nr:glycosyltransferase family 2 protein [Nitrososphaeraceae archaeon]
MISKKKPFALVIILSIFACLLLASSLVILLGFTELTIANLIAAGLTSSYLMLLFKRRHDSVRHKSQRIQIPFILFGILVIPLITTIFLSIIYTYEIYLIILSLLIPLTFINVMFFLPIAIFDRFLNKDLVNNRILTSIPLISIIVPAYNEEENIKRTLDSIIDSDYPAKEIIVVDDGSTDLTYAIALQFMQSYSKKCKITVMRKKNGGKVSAINYGLRFAVGEIVIVIDADSIIQRNTLRETAKAFQLPNVIAVAGKVKVLNPTNFLTKCTALELVLGANLLRPAFSLLGIVMVVPGALGGFAKKRIMQYGLYDRDTIAEDFDITVKLAKGGGKIVGMSAISYTQAPTTLKAFYKQRSRWYRGIFQTLLKHNDAMTNGRYGVLNKVGYPITVLMFIFPPFLDFILIAFLVFAIVEGLSVTFIFAFVLFFAFQFLLCGIAIIMDENKPWKLILYAPFSLVGYKQIINFIIIKSIFDIIKQRRRYEW